jgi:hypothetical protein
MSVCRWSDDSDVYVYYSIFGGIECSRCLLNGARIFNALDEPEMLAHLEQHKAAGHRVPCDAFDELRIRYGEAHAET